MKIAVAVSGGVDSLYAMASLAEQGHTVIALHALFLPPELRKPGYEAMLAALEGQCAACGVQLHVADCAEAFTRAVIAPFVQAYAAGRTPNPCALCNAAMKFGLLLDLAHDLGAEKLATGHYARMKDSPQGPMLVSGVDSTKDQSYFLSLVPQKRLTQVLFPLGETHKSDIRAWVTARGLHAPVAGESQEICFVPNDAYRPFVAAMAKKMGIQLPGPGPVKTLNGEVIGTHKGLWNYTEGQRKGLGIAWHSPLYVHSKDSVANILVADSKEHLHCEGFHCGHCNYLLPYEHWPQQVLVRTRYRQNARAATAIRTERGLYITEASPGGPYTPGQLATVYLRDDEDAHSLRTVAGGIIE